jgi:two-component system response regulator HydG
LGEGAGLLDAVARFEREAIQRALATAHGNRAEAARNLKISYRWLLKKLERYGLLSRDDPPGR